MGIFISRFNVPCDPDRAHGFLTAHPTVRSVEVLADRTLRAEVEAPDRHVAFAELCKALPSAFQYDDLIWPPQEIAV